MKFKIKALMWLVCYISLFSVVGYFWGGNGILVVTAVALVFVLGLDWWRFIQRKRAFQKKGSKTTRK